MDGKDRVRAFFTEKVRAYRRNDRRRRGPELLRLPVLSARRGV